MEVADYGNASVGSNGDLTYSIAADVIREEEGDSEMEPNFYGTGDEGGAAVQQRLRQQLTAPAGSNGTTSRRNSGLQHQHQQQQQQQQQSQNRRRHQHQEQARWIAADLKNGFIRIYKPTAAPISAASSLSSVVACTTETTTARICQQLNLGPHALHLEMPDGRLRRLDPYECPLAMQNAFLTSLGYAESRRVQKIGPAIDLGFLLRFYAGRPAGCRGFARHSLQGVLEVRRGGADGVGGLLARWEKRFCECSSTALTVYKGTDRQGKKSSLLLAKGSVQALKAPKSGREHCILVRGLGRRKEKEMLLAFKELAIMDRWRKHIDKSTSQHDQTADLSESHLETIPEALFALSNLRSLNLKRNSLCTKATAESQQLRVKFGYLEDLQKFHNLTVLNLSANSLTELPPSLCSLKFLVELNIASNKITSLPTQISGLAKLEILHVHNNRLASLPDSMSALTSLSMIVLAFNHFLEVPPVLAAMSKWNENIIMPGNRLTAIPDRLAEKLQSIRRINFRMNQITLSGANCLKLDRFILLAYLDLRDNLIESLDLRDLPCLEFFCCERNRLVELKLNGRALKSVLLEDNRLASLDIEPMPSQLEHLDISRNRLVMLPTYLGNIASLVHCLAAHNFITDLPPAILLGSPDKRLRVLSVHHNAIHSLPGGIVDSSVEELYLHHNWLNQLPDKMFSGLGKLKLLNLAKNRLTSLPFPGPDQGGELNSRLQELSLSFNHLDNAALRVLAKFCRLRVLRLAFNQLTELTDEFVGSLKFLQELNISGNQFRQLPSSLVYLEHLTVLKAHSNMLQDLPDFREMPELRALDLGCNQLLTGSVRDLMEARLSFLDLSCNEKMGMSVQDLTAMKTKSTIKTVSSAGVNQLSSAPSAAAASLSSSPFQFGLAESTGRRNRMCVSVLKLMPYPTPDSGLFAVFDGGRNSTVPVLLQKNFARLFKEQMRAGSGEQAALRYSMLDCHRRLQGHGQRLGASGAVLYLKRRSAERWEATVANVGNTEVVLAQRERPLRLTRLFMAQRDNDEAERVAQADGIVTEDGRVDGSSECTRQLGCGHLHPKVVPEPQVTQVNLTDTDDAIILANRSFWAYVGYEEAAEEVKELDQPVAAAKRLLDLAQAYGSAENISIIVVKIRLRNGSTLPRTSQLRGQVAETGTNGSYSVLHLSAGSSLENFDSNNSLESDTSEIWMRRRIEGYQKLKSGRTVEEIERQLNQHQTSQQQQQRMFAKRHEAAERLGTEMRLRQAGEVKLQELDSDLADVFSSPDSDSDVSGGSESGDNNWKRLGARPQQQDKMSQLMSQAHRSLINPHGEAASFYDGDRLSEITNSELLLAPPRGDRLGDAGIEPDDEESYFRDAGLDDEDEPDEALVAWRAGARVNANGVKGTSKWTPNTIGHEGMREETYMVEKGSRTESVGSLLGDEAIYARVSKSSPASANAAHPAAAPLRIKLAPSPPPRPISQQTTGDIDSSSAPPPRRGRIFADSGTEPLNSSSSPTPRTPSSTFSYGELMERRPRPNYSLSMQQSPQHRAGPSGFEDQELVVDIRSVATSLASVQILADADEDTAL